MMKSWVVWLLELCEIYTVHIILGFGKGEFPSCLFISPLGEIP